jgi:hypothetical protein
MNAVNIATIIVALIAAAGAWASQRTAARAARENTIVGGRVDMEKEAYDRARAFDTETIKRQDAELEELRQKHAQCADEIKEMRAQYETEITLLRLRIARLEKTRPSSIQEIASERADIEGASDTAV